MARDICMICQQLIKYNHNCFNYKQGDKLEGQVIQDKECKDFGKKYDDGKPMMDLLSPIAMTEIAKVMTFGAKKYGKHNWRDGLSWCRVIAAAMRHLFAFLNGEDKDPETGLSHLGHAGCCIMFLIDYETTRREFDDRYVKSIK